MVCLATRSHNGVNCCVSVLHSVKAKVHDISTGIQAPVSNAGAAQYQPTVSGDRVVWVDNHDDIYNYVLYTKDPGTGTPHAVAPATGGQWTPELSGDKLVWQDQRANDGEIYFYDFATANTGKVFATGALQTNPDISGNYAVWTDYSTGTGTVWFSDLTTHEARPLHPQAGVQYYPRISGSRVVWQCSGAVFMYDLTADIFQQISDNTLGGGGADIDGSRIVWMAYDNGNYDLYEYEPYSAKIEIDHPVPADLVVEIGCGDPSNPDWLQQVFKCYEGYAGPLSLEVPLSAAKEWLPPSEERRWFVRVADAVPGDTGAIVSFGIDVWGTVYSSSSAPLAIPDDAGFVYLWIPPLSHTFALTQPTATPNPVASGGPVGIAVGYADSLQHEVASWRWTDGGAGGSFWPSSEVQNPAYLAPINTSLADMEIRLTVSATCAAVPAIADSKSVTLLVAYDLDADGMPDAWEQLHGFNPASAADALGDRDNDGLTNLLEYQTGCDPDNRDTDGDGFGDGEEFSLGSHLRDGSSVPVAGHFSDVAPTGYGPDGADPYWAFHEIEAAYRAGIVQGVGGSYLPTDSVTRDQMAVYIARAMNGGNPTGPGTVPFVDITNPWANVYIAYCVEHGVVGGYDATHYGPTLPVTRDQMAVFVARSQGWVVIGEDMTKEAPAFEDVPLGHWAGKAIKECVDHGVVRGYDATHYQPDWVVTRDQMAVFVQRAFQLPM